MTNYNERLDELEEQFLADYRNWNDGPWDYNGLDPKQKFQQALTSLIKELVAEAKSEKLEESEYTLNMGVPHNPPSNTTRTNLYRKGYNDALDQFEQNLLKALNKEK